MSFCAKSEILRILHLQFFHIFSLDFYEVLIYNYFGEFNLSNYRRKKKDKVPDKAVPKHRLNAISKVAFIVFGLLVFRIGWIQFVDGAELKELASRQQTLNKIISPKRGTIYDTNGKVLAMSAEVDTITINPSAFIVEDKNKTDVENREATQHLQMKVAEGLSQIFSLDYETVLNQVKSEKKVETIIKKIDRDLVNQLYAWEEENKIKVGINVDPDNKRYYPYDNLASHVIGFTGTDSNGLFGVENKWDSVLQGTSREDCNDC